MSIKCSFCGLKISDIMAISDRGELPEKSEIKTFKSKMGDLIVLSAGAKVEIPELDIELYISGETGGEITTVEGILSETLEYAKILAKDPSIENPKKLQRVLKLLRREIEAPSGLLTIVIIDENRRSAIIPHETWVKRAELAREEMLELEEKEIISLGKEALKKKIKV